MSVVTHHPIPMQPRFALELPDGARILRVDYVPWISSPALWALVEPEKPTARRYFRIVPTTGDPLDMRRWSYVGTWLDASVVDSEKVWHLFEDRRH